MLALAGSLSATLGPMARWALPMAFSARFLPERPPSRRAQKLVTSSTASVPRRR